MYRKIFWYSESQKRAMEGDRMYESNGSLSDPNKGFIEDSIGRWTECRMYSGEQPKHSHEDAIIVLDRPATEIEIQSDLNFKRLLADLRSDRET